MDPEVKGDRVMEEKKQVCGNCADADPIEGKEDEFFCWFYQKNQPCDGSCKYWRNPEGSDK